VPFLVDTSVLVRLANSSDAYHAVADAAVSELHRRGEALHFTAQNLVEFHSVATRPVTANGLGLSPAQAEAKAAIFELVFPLLAETPDIFPAWKSLVAAAGVVGKRVHDARLVAVCHVYGVTHVLTFNVQHFVGLAAITPGLTIVDPGSV
jgi:predicted nucleic acid-binding protein